MEKTGSTFAVVLDFPGTAVFSGMIGVTCFGLLFTPVFYAVSRQWAKNQGPSRRWMTHADPVGPGVQPRFTGSTSTVTITSFGIRSSASACISGPVICLAWRALTKIWNRY